MMYRNLHQKSRMRGNNNVINFFFLAQILIGYSTIDGFVIPSSLTDSSSRTYSLSSSLLQLSIVSDNTDLEGKTVIELKDELRSRGLPVSGTKAKLIQRLIENNFNNDNGAADKPAVEQQGEAGSNNDVLSLRANIDPNSAIRLLPTPLLTTLAKRTDSNDAPSLLPVQELAYKAIATGEDAVLHAPTGSGKTLGYVLPLFAQLFEWKKNGTLKRKRKRRLKSEEYFAQNEPSTPAFLVIVPSRELAKQVGKICSQYHPTSSNRVATVFGGVPLERHSSLLRFKELDVIVGTPGRIRELIREEFLDLSETKSIVLDEADVLLNFDDQPEIEMILNGMKNDYQLILASATVNRLVKDFVQDVMEMDVSADSFVTVSSGDHADEVTPSSTSNSKVTEKTPSPPSHATVSNSKRPTVSHWYTAARSSARSGLASDVVATLNPRIGIIFVASKVEADTVAEEMSARLSNVRVSVLHGDMSQSARSRTVAALRDNDRGTASRILVATDVASRGLDLPGVDLVLQFGIPRQSGKEGTFDAELYTHRTGRAGRVGGGSRPADAILLFDPNQGEARILPNLQEELADDFGLFMESRPLPSPTDILEASYDRSVEVCKDIPQNELFDFFKGKIQSDMNHVLPSDREEELLHRLSAAMAALSGLDGTVPERSLLTADPRDRTLRVWSEEGEVLSPPEVTKFAKGLGSGKLGRVTICDDGSAVFDLVEKQALKVIKASKNQNPGSDGSTPSLRVELPSALP